MNTSARPMIYLSGAFSGTFPDVDAFRKGMVENSPLLCLDPLEYSVGKFTLSTVENDRLMIQGSDGVVAYIKESHGFRAGTLREVEYAAFLGKLFAVVTDTKTFNSSGGMDGWLVNLANIILLDYAEICCSEVIKSNSEQISNKPPFVFFLGKAGSGKSYYSDLVRKQIKGSSPFMFAYDLKKEVLDIRERLFRGGYPTTEEEWIVAEWLEQEPAGTKPRRTLQEYGSFKRAEDPLYWTKKGSIPFGATVCDDLRYIHELFFINRTHTPIGFYLDVPEGIRQDRLRKRDGVGMNDEAASHSSELGVDRLSRFMIPIPYEAQLSGRAEKIILETLSPYTGCGIIREEGNE